MNKEVAAMRENYALASLLENEVFTDPMQQFQSWFQESVNAQIKEPNAFVLATASSDGTPDARTVLLKGIHEEGFVFYTNYESAKGQQIQSNPKATMLFLWLDLERQIRITGSVSKQDEMLSKKYFESRPKDSQIGAIASPQSKVIPDRQFLEEKFKEVSTDFNENPYFPDNWGGYVIKPEKFEFWQGRPNRLHDRILYTFAENVWNISRLAP